jgi:hypothetical protein
LLPRPIDRWLAQQPGDFAVAVLPAGASNYQAMFGSLFHAKHLPAYNHSDHFPPAFRDFARRAAAFPAPDSVVALRQMGLRYLLLERGAFDGRRSLPWSAVVRALDGSTDLQVAGEVDGVLIVAFR